VPDVITKGGEGGYFQVYRMVKNSTGEWMSLGLGPECTPHADCNWVVGLSKLTCTSHSLNVSVFKMLVQKLHTQGLEPTVLVYDLYYYFRISVTPL
jgi:hypothetical protein